jgi:sugar phosphate isomerase/epimerase
MNPCLSQVCSLNSSFEDDIADYAAGECRNLELWLTKLEEFVKRESLQRVQQILNEHDMRATVASFQGGLLTSQGDARRLAWELFASRLDLCRELNVETIVLACDIQAPISSTDIDRARSSLRQAADEAERRQMRLALEFQGRAALGNNLQTAAALVDEIGSPHLGICLDVFHFFIGPSKLSDLQLVTRDNLFHVQISDLSDVPREFATDSHRILPGDGEFQLSPIIGHLGHIQYEGMISIELMNPQIWQVPARQFGEIAINAITRTLDLANP